MSALGYALMGAAKGLGDGMVEDAEAKREEALLRLRNGMRQDERAQNRQFELDDRAHSEARDDVQRTEDRKFEVEDRNYRAAHRGLGAGGGGGRGRGRNPDNLSANLQTRIKQRFEDAMGETDWTTFYKVRDEIMRVMNEQDVSEQEAERRVNGGMVYEDTVVEDTWMPFDRTETTERNRAGRGKWTGEFSYGEGKPEAGGGSTSRATPPRDGGEAGGDLPRPQSRAEYDALPSGAKFIDPEGKVRVKP